MNKFNINQCNITGGFFAQRQKINAETTIKVVHDRFEKTGRFEALRCHKNTLRSHIYWDSDVAKWLEAAAYLLSRKNDELILKWYNSAVEDIISNQLDNGYFNSYFQVYQPDDIFKFRTEHELYCAGHLFEASVASSKYLNDNRLLEFSEKYVDYIYDRFVVKKDTPFKTPGHEEIELALLRLYKFTKNEKYKKLAEFFIDTRGTTDEPEYIKDSHEYSQSHLPVRKQFTAEGHAVRAIYLYIAMADLANLNNDLPLKKACINIFDNIINTKMYITGGVGSTPSGENITTEYDLPNFSAYSETCASIGMAFLCDKMFEMTGDVKYLNIFERVLYNSLLSGISLNGDAFFYVNPLEMQKKRAQFHLNTKGAKERVPILKRAELFETSCCPPNLCRFFERLSQFIWYEDDNNTLILSQLISSDLNSKLAKIQCVSNMPYSGKISLKVDSFGKNIIIKIRKPFWTNKLFKNEKDGFLLYQGVFNNEMIEIDFPMMLKPLYSNPQVPECAGKIALSFGPLILCAEGTDNNFPIFSARIHNLSTAKVKILHDSCYVLNAFVPITYSELNNNKLYSYKCDVKNDVMTMIPYFAWANREENDMKVWF